MESELLIGAELNRGQLAVTCQTCKRMFFKKDLNEHLWKHAEERYYSLPKEKQFGRFRQLQKLAPKQFPIRSIRTENIRPIGDPYNKGVVITIENSSL